MAENHLEYGYLEGESIVEHFADDAELAAIKARVHEMEMEEESDRLEEERCDAIDMHLLTSSPRPGETARPFYNMTPEERMDADNRSVYVGNVDYGATADELEIHFNGCGPVNRVTILCDRFSGHPKGFAYIEFSDPDSVHSAVGLHETLFRGRVLKVMPKRTNMPGISTTDRGGHRGGHTRGRGRGFRPPRYQNNTRGRFRYQSTRPQHQTPHPYYGAPPVGKRQWGHMDYHEQMPKRYPCLLLITPPSEEMGPGSSGPHYPQQR
ncbi:embryonic polyadenylate-binding protein 2 isoform X1 [Gymnodraco acuticeps]|uniref:Embryonic polyadenylate-binding protein 2 isoform X1 n=2 Tax=Notothenioidei TaxID=8205 RepID=A0A6P8U796_GYMAC|nr:PREDICTED: embryonic polyadenylate-binding protein 2 isoform X2 [Notothenia coriiceps]XP_033971949.1 embryonic polyadenylate-binding protein 2 isoform X1 [Trematomus bernacchii]XP_034072634.1 embryonic polyadenylate-binding protein 2 isoform X1 [Gymnodraco acuticeps]KAI9531844.1 Polyadenylate-binding protein 2-B [Dissostichus eleginoides]